MTAEETLRNSASDVTGTLVVPPVVRPQCPERIDRYLIKGVLGQGGFGLIYLAFDEQLHRRVAIKVPLAERAINAADAEAYLNEARTIAGLDHPHIVPVFNVGSTPEYAYYVVSKFIEGNDLAATLKQSRPGFAEAAQLVASVAEALHYAHGRGVVHRDVKPSNILLDTAGKPYLADFGIALREADFGKKSPYAGTPPYMSPEQARGEGHRVDGRSDVYSLGVVFYELLTGRRTFKASTVDDLREQIATLEPRPPRQLNDSIPRELERICLKALSNRISDRYTTALDIAADLQHVLESGILRTGSTADFTLQQRPTSVGPQRLMGGSETTKLAPPAVRPANEADTEPSRVIPKGLRSFDEHDASFFLALLPGPRDRDGLPESLRFWKTRIDPVDAIETFSTGLIYGPSGCGKSSLVKAGLIPCLSADVVAVYVEATREGTEERLLHALRRRCPGLNDTLNLAETLTSLRRRWGVPAGKKVLIILDQFEQWLHARNEEDYVSLAHPLRQCDGANLQCLLMVRDDFWMAVTRFMRELEVRVLENHNMAAVDLFSRRHARHVLETFGRAYGALPPDPEELSPDQSQFVSRAVDSLAEEDKVVCVRLALFAEMMKFRPWSVAALKQVGGAEGVGVAFLEDAFFSSAVPGRRLHTSAARAVLSSLLPEPCSDIKGRMKSREALLAASGYGDRPRDFDRLIEILDNDLRLITPADPCGTETSDAGAGGEYYQLTHDFVVPSLRDWLTRKQKETRRGRAELLLAYRADLYNARPESRHLPSLAEYLRIVALTWRREWTEAQVKMMRAAGQWHGLRLSIGCVLLAGLLFAAGEYSRYRLEKDEVAKVNGLVTALFIADAGEISDIVAKLDEQPRYWDARLAEIANNPAGEYKDRTRATLALARGPGEWIAKLIECAASADTVMLEVIWNRLSPFRREAQVELWKTTQSENVDPPKLVRLAALLASVDPEGEDWNKIDDAVVDGLLSELIHQNKTDLDFDAAVRIFTPAAAALTPALYERYSDPSTSTVERTEAERLVERVAAESLLAQFADSSVLGQMLLDAEPSSFELLFVEGESRHRDALVAIARKAISDDGPAENPILRGKRLANAASILLRLGEAGKEVEGVLTNSADPTPRSRFILDAHKLGVTTEDIVAAYDSYTEPTARQALLLALGPYETDLTLTKKDEITDLLIPQARFGGDQSIRSAAEWVLKEWGMEEEVSRLMDEQSPAGWAPSRVTRHGHVMVVFPGPIHVSFPERTEEDEKGNENTIPARNLTLDYSLAVSDREVTVEQFLQFDPKVHDKGAYESGRDYTLSIPNGAANYVLFTEAIAYCRWLTEQEGYSEDQQCYPPEAVSAADPTLSEERLKRPGYRLLTSDEWEYLCRAGSTTPWFMGADESHLTGFARYRANEGEEVRVKGNSSPVPLLRVTSLRPNAFGLFDVAGNVAEWCHRTDAAPKPGHRGGGHYYWANQLMSFMKHESSNQRRDYIGFRIARTLSSREAFPEKPASVNE